MSSQTYNLLSWYAIHTNPKQEDRADSNLRAWGIETFVPKFKMYHLKPYTQEPACLVKHLFPRYIFARFVFSSLVHKVSYTRGIHSIVSFGNQPALLDEAIIALIRSRIDNESFVKIGDDLKLGDKVTIKEGPLKGLTGIFKHELNGNERVMILLNAISYQAQVVVNKCLVRKHSVDIDLECTM
jgi:transcriptional antiterminator RfaH